MREPRSAIRGLGSKGRGRRVSSAEVASAAAASPSPPPKGAMRELSRDITDPLGLHVQLAVLLASEAQRWRSRVTLEHAGRVVNAAQPMDLMMLGVRCGEHVTVRVEGPDEATAAGAIERIVATF